MDELESDGWKMHGRYEFVITIVAEYSTVCLTSLATAVPRLFLNLKAEMYFELQKSV